jgi:hypothetical protein
MDVGTSNHQIYDLTNNGIYISVWFSVEYGLLKGQCHCYLTFTFSFTDWDLLGACTQPDTSWYLMQGVIFRPDALPEGLLIAKIQCVLLNKHRLFPLL